MVDLKADGKGSAEENRGKPQNKILREKIVLAVSVILAAVGFIFGVASLPGKLFFFIAWSVAGGQVILDAFSSVRNGNWFDENFLMSFATFGAIAIGELPEAAAVMIFYRTGELLQQIAVDHSRKNITDLMDLRPDTANLIEDEKILRVEPSQVQTGQLILIRPGEKIPLDGIVRSGTSFIDSSALTGESTPRTALPGDNVLSGCINLSGVLTVQVTHPFGESTVSKILDLVQNASGKKAKTERFITRFSKVYTPIVIALAALIAFIPPLISSWDTWQSWLHRGLIFLVVSCPCALVISIPLGFFAGIGKASRQGILIKGSNYLEALNRVRIVAFDKTGTLTKGTFKVMKTLPAAGFSDREILGLAAQAEHYSSHPIARSILEAADYPDMNPDTKILSEYSGEGIQAQIDGKTILAGNRRLFERFNIPLHEPQESGTLVHIASEGIYVGTIVIADEVKPDSQKAIADLRAEGVSQLIMLTGDHQKPAEAIAETLKLDRVYAELLPDQKVEMVETLLNEKRAEGSLVFVGDGINDAPVLMRADVGVAMGKSGADAAIEAADVVIITDEPSRIPMMIQISRKTNRIVWQNIILTLGFKALVLILSAFGLVSMWLAVLADVGIMLLAVLNALRILR